MAPYLATATIGEFDLRAYEQDGIRFWDAIDPDLFDPVAVPRTGEQYAMSQRPSRRTSGWPARSACRPAGDAVVLGHPRHRAGLGLRLRRGAHGRQDDWTTLPRPERPHAQDTGFVCPFWLVPPVPRRTTRPARRRHVLARPARRATGARRAAERRVRAVDGRPVGLRRAATSRCRSPTRATTGPAPGRLRRRHRRLHRRGHDLVRGRRRTRSTAGRFPARRPAAPPTPTTGSPARPPTPRRHRGRRRAVLRPPARDHRLPVGHLRPLPVLARRAGSSTTSRAWLRAGDPDPPDLRAASSPTRSRATA